MRDTGSPILNRHYPIAYSYIIVDREDKLLDHYTYIGDAATHFIDKVILSYETLKAASTSYSIDV